VETFTTWRELLGNIIQDVFERQRIASELGVNAVTLTRWVHGSSTPRSQHLRRLLAVLPHHRDQLFELISREDGDALIGAGRAAFDDEEDEIPPEFYARVFNAYAMTPRAQRSWSVTNLILQQALAQLDPHQRRVSRQLRRSGARPFDARPFGRQARDRRRRALAGYRLWPAIDRQQFRFGSHSPLGAADPGRRLGRGRQ